jgi:outer membrane protein assembly factor BamA
MNFAKTLLVILSLSFALNLLPSMEAEAEDNWIWIPIVFYTPESQGGFGLMLIQKLWKEAEGKSSNIRYMGMYTLANQFLTSFMPTLYFWEGQFEIGTRHSYQEYPNNFYGLGNETDIDDEETYKRNKFTNSIWFRWFFWQPLFIGATFQDEKRKIVDWDEGGIVEPILIAGGEDFHLQSITGQFGYDSRDFPQSPFSGMYHRLWARSTRGLSADYEESFKSLGADLRFYAQVFTEHVWALQIEGVKIEGDAIPFFALAELGGSNVLRGIYLGRYRDRARVSVQTEYRMPFIWKLNFVLGVGAGQVAEEPSEFAMSRFHNSANLGVRYKLDPEERTMIRFDLGFAEDDIGVYFTIDEAF